MSVGQELYSILGVQVVVSVSRVVRYTLQLASRETLPSTGLTGGRICRAFTRSAFGRTCSDRGPEDSSFGYRSKVPGAGAED